MRVATTVTGSNKIHLIDQTSLLEDPIATACGRIQYQVAFIKRPKPEECCQVCVGAMLSRLGKLFVKWAEDAAQEAKAAPDVPAQQEIK